MEEKKKRKKKLSFPTAFTICFIVIIIATILTWVIPAGGFDTIEYDQGSGNFTVKHIKDGSTESLPATQETLDKFEIKADLTSFTEGKITKPLSIKGTYTRVEQQPQGIYDFLKAPILGTTNAIDIILFCFMLGGTIGIMNCIGVFNAGVAALAKASRGREKVIVVFVTILITIGGTIFGFCEETIAFYPLFVPVFLAAGFDGMTAVGAIYCGSTIGCMFSTTNPFATVIGSYAAGISFTEGIVPRIIGLVIGLVIVCVYVMRYAEKVRKDPSKSLSKETYNDLKSRYSVTSASAVPEFTVRLKICLFLFLAAFVVMVWGISSQGWSFTEMSVIFLVAGIVIGIIGGLKEKQIVSHFVEGASTLVGVALIVGIARGVGIVLEAGQVSGTILENMSRVVDGLPPAIFVILLMIMYILLGLFINSSSGVALLSLPIIAPLADVVGVPREVVISAFIYGMGIITFISPTSICLPSIEMVNVSYIKWIKFAAPLVGICTVLCAVMLLVQLYLF